MKQTLLAITLVSGCTLYLGGDEPQDLEGAREPAGSTPPTCGAAEVHVIGVYETRDDHDFNAHPIGDGHLRIERAGHHRLVLSAYEPTRWHLDLAPGAIVDAVHLVGYHAQTLAQSGIPITYDTYEQGGESACGYSWPYDGEGCDTNQLLSLARARAGSDITTFNGCYHAATWTLGADGTATSDCDTAAGYEKHSFIGACTGAATDWIEAAFQTQSPPACTGGRYVRYNAQYNAWVGAIQCGSAERYKLYLSEDRDQPFLEIADYAGHGQDHCELVNAEFSIPDEDDITSGGCAACTVDDLVDLIDVPVYARANFGEPFERVTSREWADLTTTSYRCGVSIP